MEKIVGKIKSNFTEKEYNVKWNITEKNSWIERKPELWELVSNSIYSEIEALAGAQKFINHQKENY